MCKVAACTKINNKNREDVWMFMMMLGDLISRGNNDGLGYAAFDAKGNIFGEKWLHNKNAFLDISKHFGHLTAEKMNRVYTYFGDVVKRDEAQAIILHTRMATCTKGIENTHPFVNDKDNPEIAIIHNGVISNHFDLEKKYSTCDSEVIAHLYDKHGVKLDLKNLNDVTQRLFGWYTVLALAKDGVGRMYMDAFSDSNRLSSYFIPELDTRIYSTSAQDIQEIAKLFGYSIKDGQQLKPCTALRIDVLTGEVIDRTKFKEMEIPRHQGYGHEHWPDVTWMEGNFDDEEFQKSFWSYMKGRH